MTFMSYARIDPLLDAIETQRRVVDARLTQPARWRGQLRREGKRGPQPQDRSRYASAFDSLAAEVAAGRDRGFTADAVRGLHAALTGTDGAYRGKEVRVGGFATSARAAHAPGLVDQAIARAVDGSEPPALAAARLHMEMLLIHPWSDGNGRTARLAASWLLMRAGFRSTLLTAVEEHVALVPGIYARAFRILRSSEPTQHEPWLTTYLQLMAWNSEMAAAFREREAAMRAFLAEQGVEAGGHDALMLAFDSGEPVEHAVLPALQERFLPWVEFNRHLHPDKRRAFAFQVERLSAEEGD